MNMNVIPKASLSATPAMLLNKNAGTITKNVVAIKAALVLNSFLTNKKKKINPTDIVIAGYNTSARFKVKTGLKKLRNLCSQTMKWLKRLNSPRPVNPRG